jgi:hypothetical protein
VGALAAVTSVTSLIAHQGGWDEFLLVAAPVAILAALLGVAKRRIDRANRSEREDAPNTPSG